MRRFLVGALTVFGLMALFGTAPAAAQDAATPIAPPVSNGAALTIALFTCPSTMAADEIDPAECTTPAQGVQFTIFNWGTENVESGTTKGDGLVSFPLDKYILSPDGSEVNLAEVRRNNPYGELTGYAVSCTRNGEPLDFKYVQPEAQADFGISFTAHPGDQIACEWYDTLASSGGQQNGTNVQTGQRKESGGAVTKLPTTGSGEATSPPDSALPLWLTGMAAVVLFGGFGFRRMFRR